MCGSHYKRWYRYGDPLAGQVHRFESPEKLFEERTEWIDGCLIWQASLESGAKDGISGYGRMQFGGKTHQAHRWAWEQANGKIPAGMVIDHKCWNRACVNVDHLRVVTRKQNNAYRGGPQSTTATGVRGVTLKRGQYYAQVMNDKRNYRKGPFATIEEADNAAHLLRVEMFGEYAGRG